MDRNFVDDGSVSGDLVTDADLGETILDSYFDIEHLRPFIASNGELVLIGRTGTAAASSNIQTTFVAGFGSIPDADVRVSHVHML